MTEYESDYVWYRADPYPWRSLRYWRAMRLEPIFEEDA